MPHFTAPIDRNQTFLQKGLDEELRSGWRQAWSIQQLSRDLTSRTRWSFRSSTVAH